MISFEITVILAFVCGTVMGFAFSGPTISHLNRKIRELRCALQEGTAPPKTETMKRVVWVCVLNGFAWVWCSYVLAAMDKPQIAEELSKVALIEIIAPVVVYAAKSAIENLSKNNAWPDKPEQPPDDEGGVG